MYGYSKQQDNASLLTNENRLEATDREKASQKLLFIFIKVHMFKTARF
jgi:hypothetical protein